MPADNKLNHNQLIFLLNGLTQELLAFSYRIFSEKLNQQQISTIYFHLCNLIL